MMTIRVLGSGLIPRGLGLAPRMAPTPASLTLIQTIMATKGLTVEFCKPDGTWIKLTRENLTGMWAAYGANNAAVKPVQTATTVNGSKPVTPEPKFATAATAPAATNVVNEKTEAPAVKADDKVAEKKDEPTSAESKDEKTDEKKNNNLKVVNNPNDKKHN